MISFFPSTPMGFALFILIVMLGPKRGLPVLFASMPFGATAVFSAQGIGNVVLPDFCAIAYVLSVWLRSTIDDFIAATWPGRAGFPLIILCTIVVMGAWALPQIFAGKTFVYTVQKFEGRAYIGLNLFAPSGGQAGQAARFLLGGFLFLSFLMVRWRFSDLRLVLKAWALASAAHILVSLADWVSYPLGFAFLLDPIRTVLQAILLDQHFGEVRRLIGGQTEPASFGLYSIGLFGFWLRFQLGSAQLKGSSILLLCITILALRSTSSATIVNLCLVTCLLLLWHWARPSNAHAKHAVYVYLAGALPALIAFAVALLAFSETTLDLADALFIEKVSSVSGQERFSWNAQALRNFNDSYGLGLGIGSVRASGWGFAVLGNLGWPGALVFAWFLTKALRSTRPVQYDDIATMEISSAMRWGGVAVLLQSVLTTPFPNLGLPFFAMIGMAVALDQTRQRHSMQSHSPAHSAARPAEVER